jgi:hypothetical protein
MVQHASYWSSSVDTYIAGVESAFARWESYMDTIESKTIGPDLDSLKTKTENIKNASKDLTTEITKDGGLLDALEKEYDDVSALTLEYSKNREEILKTIGAYKDLVLAIDEAIEKESEESTEPTDSGDGTDSGGEEPKSEEPTETNTGNVNVGSQVKVKTSATNFSRDGGNGTVM